MDINFLRLQREAAEEQLKKEKRIALYAEIALGVFLVVTVGVFVAHIFVQKSIQKVADSIITVQQQLKKTVPIQKDYVVYATKVQFLYNIERERVAKREALKYFYALIPKDYVLTSSTVLDKEKKIQFTLQSQDVFQLENLISLLYSEDIEKNGYVIEGNTLNRKKDALYQLQGTFSYEAKASGKQEK